MTHIQKQENSSFYGMADSATLALIGLLLERTQIPLKQIAQKSGLSNRQLHHVLVRIHYDSAARTRRIRASKKSMPWWCKVVAARCKNFEQFHKRTHRAWQFYPHHGWVNLLPAYIGYSTVQKLAKRARTAHNPVHVPQNIHEFALFIGVQRLGKTVHCYPIRTQDLRPGQYVSLPIQDTVYKPWTGEIVPSQSPWLDTRENWSVLDTLEAQLTLLS